MTAQLGLSQVDYPKIKLIDTDTVVMFTPSQVKKMHSTFIELDKKSFINKSLIEEINIYTAKTDNLINQVSVLRSKATIMENISSEQQQQVISLEDIVLKKDKKISTLKKTRNLYTILGVVGGVVGSYYLNKR